MSLRLRILVATCLPIDGSWCRPAELAAMSAVQLSRLPVLCGNRLVPLGDLWEVKHSAGQDDEVVLEGNHVAVHDLGRGMTGGRLRIVGDVGDECGTRMSGGELIVEGSARDGLGRALAGGRIEVRGNTGHFAGGHAPGASRGMTGGEIWIGGDAGDLLGARMRRGCISVNGACGSLAGQALIAGTVLVRCQPGDLPGVGMKRGTIATLQSNIAPRGDVFAHAWMSQPRFLAPYLRRAPADWKWTTEWLQADWDCYRGDVLHGGLGEFWAAC